LSQHSTVREIVVVARDAGQHKELVAYIVPAGHASDVELILALRTHLLQRLPDYMVPAAFVLLDHLPLTPNGKIDRKALSAKRREEAPAGHDKQASGQADELQKPRTPTEEMLVAIWAEVLGFSQVGIRDNFFELGGHSLLATQVISRMTNTFESTLPIQVLLYNHTITQFAEQIEGVKKVDRAPIEALPRHSVPFGYDELPLSYAQQRLCLNSPCGRSLSRASHSKRRSGTTTSTI